MAVLDFNKDGVPDLAVGAPSVGADQLTYTVRLLLAARVEQGGKGGGMGWEGRSQREACWTQLLEEAASQMCPADCLVVGELGPPIWVLDVTSITWQHLFRPPWPQIGLLVS